MIWSRWGKTTRMSSQKRVVVPPPEWIEDAPLAIIVDLDGTIANIGDRSVYAGHECAVDTLNEVVQRIAERWQDDWDDMQSPRHVIFCSGRQGTPEARKATIAWLLKHGYWDIENTDDYVHLFMRDEGDNRKDSIIKKEIYDDYIAPNFNIDFVMDDRNQVVDMWRKQGLICLQVAAGDF